MESVPTWIQIWLGFGGFTLANILTTAVLVGRAIGKTQETLKGITERTKKLEDKVEPEDSDDRFLTVKDCMMKQSSLIACVMDIKSMISDMDKRNDARMTRIEGRREEMFQLVCTLSGRVEALKE